jgi:hypothetical protein
VKGPLTMAALCVFNSEDLLVKPRCGAVIIKERSGLYAETVKHRFGFFLSVFYGLIDAGEIGSLLVFTYVHNVGDAMLGVGNVVNANRAEIQHENK